MGGAKEPRMARSERGADKPAPAAGMFAVIASNGKFGISVFRALEIIYTTLPGRGSK
jgi:hypothetical protein